MHPELACDIYDKFVEGDLDASTALQTKPDPIRLSRGAASLPASSFSGPAAPGRCGGRPHGDFP